MTETCVRAQDLLMIGDTTYDMAMATNAGVRSIGVAWGYHGVDTLMAQGADAIVSSCAELGETLDGFIACGDIPLKG